MTWRCVSRLLIGLVFLATAAEAQDQRKTAAGIPQTETANSFHCRVYCSTTKLRTPVAELNWKVSGSGLSDQRLDVSVYSDGFERGLYASLSAIKRGEQFVLRRQKVEGREQIPGLDLIVSEVRPPTLRSNTVMVKVEGLQPGLYYFWRLRPSSAGLLARARRIDCQAPVCPADMHSEPTRPQ